MIFWIIALMAGIVGVTFFPAIRMSSHMSRMEEKEFDRQKII